MSREEQRRRIPTSDELERQGALIPATGAKRSERRGGLLKFLRASRFRVSDDVAARKHVGSQQARPSPIASGTRVPTTSTNSKVEMTAASRGVTPPAVPTEEHS